MPPHNLTSYEVQNLVETNVENSVRSEKKLEALPY